MPRLVSVPSVAKKSPVPAKAPAKAAPMPPKAIAKAPPMPPAKAPAKAAPMPPKAIAKAPPKAAPAPSTALVAKPAAAPSALLSAAEFAALKTALSAANEEIKKLTKAAAKTRGPIARSAQEILDIASVPADWRADYHGSIVHVKAWDRKKGNGKEASVELTGESGYPVLCAIPRDLDGSWGTEARARGELALHYRQDESGRYVGEPVYVNAGELAMIWDHVANGGEEPEAFEEEDFAEEEETDEDE